MTSRVYHRIAVVLSYITRIDVCVMCVCLFVGLFVCSPSAPVVPYLGQHVTFRLIRALSVINLVMLVNRASKSPCPYAVCPTECVRTLVLVLCVCVRTLELVLLVCVHMPSIVRFAHARGLNPSAFVLFCS